jgi:phosphocarrier protein
VTTCAVKIVNPLGLHARAAAKFVHLASSFAASVRVAKGGREIDGKSIMGLLLLSAARGSTVTISVDGEDEEPAIAALCGLIERGFDEVTFDASPRGPFGGAQGGPFSGAQGEP